MTVFKNWCFSDAVKRRLKWADSKLVKEVVRREVRAGR